MRKPGLRSEKDPNIGEENFKGRVVIGKGSLLASCSILRIDPVRSRSTHTVLKGEGSKGTSQDAL